jgi:hypothetical protein
MDTAFKMLALVAGSVVCVLVGGFGVLILWEMWVGNIDISKLISEPTGDASMSRFQLLVFTFVIALSLFLVVVATSSLPNIPGTVLTLLGISGSSYLVSKGIQFSDPAGITPATGQGVVITPTQALVRYGQTQQFKAEVPGQPNATVKWAKIAGFGDIDAQGLYTAPATAPADLPAGSQAHATIQVTSDDSPDAHDLAVITLV